MMHKEKGEFYVIAGAIIIAGALAGLGSYLGGKASAGNGVSNNAQTAYGDQTGIGNDAKQPTAPAEIAPVTAADHIQGSANAKVIIVEYSDPECPFCKMFDSTMKSVMEKYKSNKDVAWVYRNFPLESLHRKARKEAEATECAAELGGNSAFWKYYDRLFSITTSNDGLDAAQLPEIAKYVGLDIAKFNSCLSSGKYSTKIDVNLKDGGAAGVNGTPTSFVVVNGKIVDTIVGAVPESQITTTIDKALKGN